MRFEVLALHNIRSYEKAEVRFPEGTVLLSGDIGCGKTTILLGIEFALFGLLRGQIQGPHLLRHGAREGHVTLDFEVSGKKVRIKRALKRTSSSVQQDAGELTIDGVTQQGTAVELKSKILELLGYPESLLSKSKTLIYRYTVYTPQEMMKAILYEQAEERINTFRKLFDIDKYARVKENAGEVAREYRREQERLQGRVEALQESLGEVTALKERAVVKRKAVKEAKTAHATASAHLKTCENALSELEKEREAQVAQQAAKAKLQASVDVTTKALARVRNELEKLENEPLHAPKHVPDVNSLLAQVKTYEDALGKARVNLTKAREGRTKHATKAEEAKERLKKVTALDECPLCLQDVSSDHKAHITKKEEEQIKEWEGEVARFENYVQSMTEKEEKLVTKISSLREEQQAAHTVQAQVSKAQAYEKEVKRTKKRVGELQEEIITQEKALQEKRVEPFDEAPYQQAKTKVREAQAQVGNTQAQVATEEATLQGLEEAVAKSEERKQQLAMQKKLLEGLRESETWMSSFFLNLITTIEKQVLLKLYKEFRLFFKEWFSMLIDDDSLSLEVDDNFNVTVLQNGHDSSIENLSGGERTSVALAYRLALNRVLNDFVGSVKTKDVLVLDEPTDGFSSEQLDKVREVLDELHVKQIILVSHEPKLESYVDAVVRVVKSDGVSKVLGNL